MKKVIVLDSAVVELRLIEFIKETREKHSEVLKETFEISVPLLMPFEGKSVVDFIHPINYQSIDSSISEISEDDLIEEHSGEEILALTIGLDDFSILFEQDNGSSSYHLVSNI